MNLFYRTTFVKENKQNQGQWILGEINNPYHEMEDPLLELRRSDAETITVFTTPPESPARFLQGQRNRPQR